MVLAPASLSQTFSSAARWQLRLPTLLQQCCCSGNLTAVWLLQCHREHTAQLCADPAQHHHPLPHPSLPKGTSVRLQLPCPCAASLPQGQLLL